jgi:rod shape determining protein RodA
MNTILVPSFLLSFFGVFNILGIKQSLFINELQFVFFALIAFFIVKKVGRNFFRLNASFFYWSFIVVLVVTYIIGYEAKGSKRWIDLYFFNFQASEFFKVFFILFISRLLSEKSKQTNDLFVFLASLFYFLLPFVIILKQPDLGNAAVFGVIYLTILLFSDLGKKYLTKLMILGLMVLPVGWLLLKPYQKARILSFASPNVNYQGTAYNMIQAVITIGSGKFFGRGLGLGTQSRLYFLPENHTDFAFASLVEQFGFLGGFFVLLFYLLIVLFLIKRTLKFFYSRDDEGKENFLFLIGFLTYFVFQVFVNVGMNLGILPIAGIALPFISYGGSAVVTLLIGIALLP